MNIYTVKSTDIVHNTSIDLITRWFTREVHIVQYDNSQPIVAVELFKNSERFVLPDGYEANLRFGKKDRTFIYKPVLGCNQGRDTVYFAVDEQMSMFYGKVNPIIEFTYNGAVVGSSSIPFVIDKNPIQIGDVESKSDYPAIVERISAAEAAASDAKKAVDAEAAERASGDAKTLSDARAYTDSSTSGLVSDSTTIKSNITTLQSDVASLKTDNTQNKTDIATKQDKLVSGTNIKTINGNSILGTGDITISGGGTNYITETTDTLVLTTVNTNGNKFEVRNKTDDTVVSFTQNAPGNSSSYDLFTAILSTAPNEDGELYNIVASFTKDENWDAKLHIFANAGSSGTGFDITIPPDAYGNIAMASDLEPLKTSIGNKQDTLVSGTNIKTINGESILGSGNITINGGSGGSGLAAPWSADADFLGIWSKSSPELPYEDLFKGLHIDRSLMGFEATNLTSNKDAIIIPTLTSDIPLFIFTSLDGSITSMVKLPNDFFTKSTTIDLGNIASSGGSGGSEYFDIHPTNITITPDNDLEFNITESEYNEILTNKRNVLVVLPESGPSGPKSSDAAIGLKFEYDTNPGLLYYSEGPVFKSTIVENYDPTVSSKSTLSYATLMLFKDGESYRGRYSEHCVYRGISMISNEKGHGIVLTDEPYNPDKPYEGAVYFGKINGRSVIDNNFELQPTLVSGTNIKTINGESILGSGNITISGGSGSARPPLYSHTITLKGSGNSAYFAFTIYARTDEEVTKDTLFNHLNWNVCAGTGAVSNALIDKITFGTTAEKTQVHRFLELTGQYIEEIDANLTFDIAFGTDFTVEDVVRGPDWTGIK